MMTLIDFGMTTDREVIDGWQFMTEEEAIEAAIEEFGEREITSVAYCALMARDNRDGAEYRFWFDLFLKLVKASHTGWA
jgi:hypothetical protein